MQPVRHVAVVGRDAAAWIVALGLTRAFGPVGVTVSVVELPSWLSAADAYVALPSLAALHDLLGLPEATLLKACRGVPVLGQRFVDWSPTLPPFLHGYDVQRPAINDVDFLQFWVKARGEGLNVALEDFSLAAAAAKQGRVGGKGNGGDGSAPAGASPGYHLDARGYVRLLRTGAVQAGMTVRTGTIGAVERRGEAITAVVLDGGERVEADLFVDATGAEAALIGGAPGDRIESWGRWFGSDRQLAASLPIRRPLPAFGQVAAFEQGWIGLHPLQDRTAMVAVYAGEGRSDDEFVARLSATIGAELRDPVVTSASPGGRTRPWIGNCVAVGEAATTLEPLDAVRLHMIQVALSNLIALWPVDTDMALEAAAYNRAVGAQVAHMRDFQIAHYRLNGRTEPFWARARAATGPADLDARLSLFAANGQMPTFDDEAFLLQSWTASFVGHGVIPRAYDPAVELVPVEEQMGKFQRLLGVIADQVRAMPTIEAYLADAARPV